MAKDRSLDTSRTAAAVILACLLMLSCSLPRISVLKDPLTPDEHLTLGISYEERGEYDAALEHYEAASEKIPGIYLYIGNVHFQKKEYDKAEASYRQAIEATGDPAAYNNLAWLFYTTDKELNEAEELAQKALSLAGDNQEFRDTLNRIREKKAALLQR